MLLYGVGVAVGGAVMVGVAEGGAEGVARDGRLKPGAYVVGYNQIDPATGKPAFALNAKEFRTFAELDPKSGKGKYFVTVIAEPDKSAIYHKTNVHKAIEYRIWGPHEVSLPRQNPN